VVRIRPNKKVCLFVSLLYKRDTSALIWFQSWMLPFLFQKPVRVIIKVGFCTASTTFLTYRSLLYQKLIIFKRKQVLSKSPLWRCNGTWYITFWYHLLKRKKNICTKIWIQWSELASHRVRGTREVNNF